MSRFLIYKSSAGSGKTSALVSVFLELMLSSEDPHFFRRILAITFTNKATYEMKERLMHELLKIKSLPESYSGGDYMVDGLLGKCGIGWSRLKERAEKAFTKMLFDQGSVGMSTIDRFNHRLIRAFSRDLKLRSDFTVELDTKALFEEAIQRLLDEVGENEKLTSDLEAFVEQRQREDSKARVVEELRKLRAHILSEEAVEPLRHLSAMESGSIQRLQSQWWGEKKDFENKLRSIGARGMAILQPLGATASDFAQKSNSWIPLWEHWAEGKKYDTIPSNTRLDLLQKEDWSNAKAPKQIQDAIKAASPELIALAEEAVEHLKIHLEGYLLRLMLLKRIYLFAVIDDLRSALRAICQERNILPINQFNPLISQALREEPAAFIYEKLGARYRHILIDEFQDTSSLQWHNLLPLIEDSLAQGRRSMVVGDAKQSIYRWRSGKAEQLIDLPIVRHGEAGIDPLLQKRLIEEHHIEHLSTNYRSGGNIIDFNNVLFPALAHIMLDPRYSYYDAYCEVKQEVPEKAIGLGYVEVNYLGAKEELGNQDEWVYRQIQGLREKGYSGGDICILLRSVRKKGQNLAAYLAERGVEVKTSDSRSIDKDPVVRMLVAFIRWVHNPGHNAAILAIMRCLHIWRDIPMAPGQYLVDKGGARPAQLDLHRYLDDHSLPRPEPSHFASGTYQCLNNLIDTYLPEARFEPAIRALLDFVYSQGGISLNTADFLEIWGRSKDLPGAGNSDSNEAVQIMTIHKAKGLQFKAVIIPDLDWRMSQSINEQWVHLKEAPVEGLEYAILNVSSKLKNVGLTEVAEKEELANLFDNLNLMYVAATRAEQALFINYYSPSKGGTKSMSFYFEQALADIADAEGLPLMRDCEAIEHPWYAGMALSPIAKCQRFGELSQNKIAVVQGQRADREEQNTSSTSEAAMAMSPPKGRAWHERFPPAYRPESLGKALTRKMGIYFHRMAAESRTMREAEQWIAHKKNRGEISSDEEQSLIETAGQLFSDPRYDQCLSQMKPWAERDLYHDGQFLRPDLILEGEGHYLIIDFKTGAEKPSHREQVDSYAEALRAISGSEVRASLLYLSPLRWVDLQTRSASIT